MEESSGAVGGENYYFGPPQGRSSVFPNKVAEISESQS
ncbi:hypothetical protein M5D96_011979, partial [Drosophila gunungcola]